jgi:hypothetical protein
MRLDCVQWTYLYDAPAWCAAVRRALVAQICVKSILMAKMQVRGPHAQGYGRIINGQNNFGICYSIVISYCITQDIHPHE